MLPHPAHAETPAQDLEREWSRRCEPLSDTVAGGAAAPEGGTIVSDDSDTTPLGRPGQTQPAREGAELPPQDAAAATPDGAGTSRRTGLLLAGAAVAAVAAIAVVASCLPSPPPAAPTAPSTTTSARPVPVANGPVITSFQIIDDISCTGSTVPVPVSWATRNAQTVKIQVDRQALSSSTDYALEGIGQVTLPCDGREHEVVLVAIGPGKQVSVARQVNTSNTPPPVNTPSITQFDLLDDVTCTGTTVDVPAAWLTQNAQAVNFSVDGQPLPAAAGFSVSGVGAIAVPCDGNAHKVTLTATGGGTSTSLSRSVNTSASSSGGTTTPTAPSSTTAPTAVPTS